MISKLQLALPFVAAVAASVPLYALNPDSAVSQYVHTAWKSDAGLQAVRRLKQTHDGYLWLATRGGLVRFDGVRFVTFKASSNEGLESSTMQDLVLDPDGSVWAGSLGGGIAHYHAGKFRSYTTRDGLPSNDIGSLYRDTRGVLWVGTRGGEIARMARGRFEKVSLDIPPSPITAFLEDSDRSLWIATFGNGVFRLRNGMLTPFSVKDGLPDARIATLYRGPSGDIWTAGWKGLSSWNGTRFISHGPINAVVNYAIACTHDRDGNLWVASSSGLFRAHGEQVTKLDRSSGLSSDFVSDVFEDREGNLWAATRSGLDRLRDGQVRMFTTREGLRDPGPIVADQRAVWTVSSKQVAKIATDEMSVWSMALPAGSLPATMLSQSNSGFLIGFDKGLKHWNRGQAATAPEIAGLNVRCLLRARDGSIWMGTANRGLLRWNPSGTSRLLVDTPVRDRFISTLVQDFTGAIWAGSNNGGGLYRIAGQEVQHFGAGEGLPSVNIYALFVDGKGNIWIGSANGLSWFQEGRIRSANSQQGLPSDQVFAILDDSYDRLWFTGYGGIAAIAKESLIEWAAGRRDRLNPTVYRGPDGMQIWTVSRVFPNAVRTADGHLWFSIADGLSEVTPAKPGGLLGPEFQVLIEDVTVDRVPHTELSRIRIPPGARSVEIRYTALTLSNAETVRFRYRLEGVDKGWVEADSRRIAYYNNLDPGTYKFRVVASAQEEQWYESSAMVLEQLPFFHQTRGFMLLVVASAVTLVFFVHRLRLRHAVNRIQAGFQERMDERTRIAQELHDTVVQAISGSTMLVENAAEKVPDSLPVVKGALLRAVDRLDLALTESRAALRGLRGSATFEATLAKQLSDIAGESQPSQIAFRLLTTGEPRAIRPAIQYEVSRIASEAIVNAFKHSRAKVIRVELDYTNALRVFVHDDGEGISEQMLLQGKDGHFGLAGMRERAERIGARLDVSSRVGEGTRVGITIPAEIAFEKSSVHSPLLARALSRLATVRHRPAPQDRRSP